MPESLRNPPTEENTDARPSVHKDSRYEETKVVADQVNEESTRFANSRKLPDLTRGETARQEIAAQKLSEDHNKENANERDSILLVEDNLINQKVLRRQLQSKGFEVSYEVQISRPPKLILC